MKIRVEKIGNKAIEIEEETPASSWDMNLPDVTLIDSVNLKCKFSRSGEEIIVDSLVVTQRESVCSRCLSQVRQVLEQSFKRSYKAEELGEYLEVNDDIREDILLNFSMKVLCKEDCKGLCSHCGVNLNCQECKCQMKPGIMK